MKKFLKNLLRELTITFDVMLGGDHRKYGHLPPPSIRLYCDECKEGEHRKPGYGSKACQCGTITCACFAVQYHIDLQKELSETKVNPVLAHANENWVLVERHVSTYNPPDFHLIFKRGEMLIDTPVPEDVWRAFDGLKLPNPKPTPTENKGTQGNWRVIKELEQPPRIVAYGVGRWQDDCRTVAIMKDNSILSNEDAELIVDVVNGFRKSKSGIRFESNERMYERLI